MKFEEIEKFIDLSPEETTWDSGTAKKDNLIYSPKASEGKNGVYNAIIRPIPSSDTEIINKKVLWINDERTGLRGYYDSRAHLGKGKCELNDLFWYLKKHEDVRMQRKLGSNFSMKEQNYCYAYVIKDPQNPELEGKVVIWRFPRTIKKLFDAQRTPTPEDIAIGAEPCNVFNVFEGKDFMLKIETKGEWPDYSSSRFAESTSGLKIKVADNGDKSDYVEIEKGNKDHISLLKEKVYNEETIPDISSFKFKDWTDEEHAKIKKFVSIMKSGNSDSIDTILNKTEDKPDEPMPDTKQSTKDPIENFESKKPSSEVDGEETDSEDKDVENILDGLDF